MEETLHLKSADETLNLASSLIKYLPIPSIITLNGNLGAGKTIFAKGLAKGLNIKQDVTSPTFNILKCYFDGNVPFYHIDAYRLEDSQNKDIGLEEVIDGNGICVIEWPNYIKEIIFDDLNIDIQIISLNERVFTFKSENKKYEQVFTYLEGLKNVL